MAGRSPPTRHAHLHDTDGRDPLRVVPIGAILAYGGATAPTGFLLCDGTAVSRTVTYAALFAILGTAFGVGDGSTTFNLPDLRQRFPLGKATSGTGSTLGGTGGNVDHTHAVGTLANANESAHTHGAGSYQVTVAGEDAQTPVAPVTVGRDGVVPVTGTSAAGSAHTHTLSGSTASGNPPFQAVNFIIRAT